MRTAAEVMKGWDVGISGSLVRENSVVHVEHIWDTVITIKVSGTRGREENALAVVEECRNFFIDVDQTFSTYKPLSEVSLHRLGLDGPGRHTDEFLDVLRACDELRVTTAGAFDPWAVRGGYDPSGYVKGWAAGRASERLVSAGFVDHFVNAGGDICASGDEDVVGGEGWPAGILNPHRPSEIVAVVTLRDEAMATSGRYERGDHVIDPATGEPAIGVDSATVVGPDAGVADALASAAMVRGVASVEWFDTLGPEWSLHLVIGDIAHTHGRSFEG
jgi:thiamine biosynthesis lipoprotein